MIPELNLSVKIYRQSMVATKVVESLSSLDRLSKKASAFDKERFKSGVISLFKERGQPQRKRDFVVGYS